MSEQVLPLTKEEIRELEATGLNFRSTGPALCGSAEAVPEFADEIIAFLREYLRASRAKESNPGSKFTCVGHRRSHE